MKIKIEKGVPIPGGDRTERGALTAALHELKVGDSFLYKGSARNGIYSIATRCGITIAIRTDSNGMARVWRTK